MPPARYANAPIIQISTAYHHIGGRANLLNFTSLWTPFDLIILPPSSSQLGIGAEMQIPALTHPMMVSDRRTLKAISDALSQPVKSPT